MDIKQAKELILGNDDYKMDGKYVYGLYSDKYGHFKDVGFADKTGKKLKLIWTDELIYGWAWFTRKQAAKFQKKLLKTFGIKTRITKV